jgi:hypothetical protein
MSLNQNVINTVRAKNISKKTTQSTATSSSTATITTDIPISTIDSKETDSDSSASEGETSDEPSRPIRRFGNDPEGRSLGTNIDKAESSEDSKSTVDECPAELKTLRYKIMLMNGNTPVEVAPPAKNSYDNLQQFLDKERNNNTRETWSKLNKSVKHKKIVDFVTTYTTSNNLSEEERDRLLEVLKQNMTRGKLAKNKEVNYDKAKGIIKDMPCLVFNKTTRHFTIRNMDAQKHTTTIKKAPFIKVSSGGGGIESCKASPPLSADDA